MPSAAEHPRHKQIRDFAMVNIGKQIRVRMAGGTVAVGQLDNVSASALWLRNGTGAARLIGFESIDNVQLDHGLDEDLDPVERARAEVEEKIEAVAAVVPDVATFRRMFRIPESVDNDLAWWWLQQAAEDLGKTAPKTQEYGGAGDGSADLRTMGYALAELCGLHDAEEPVKLELAVWFYALGKISRLISDYKAGRPGKADTWFDLAVYAQMGRRIQATGRWP